jgi:hypothetical protein
VRLGQRVEEGRQRAQLRGGVVQRVHRRAEGGAAGQGAHGPADVLAALRTPECSPYRL